MLLAVAKPGFVFGRGCEFGKRKHFLHAFGGERG
jgi:hypothetical protein